MSAHPVTARRPFLLVDWARRFTFSLRDLLFDPPEGAPQDLHACTLVFPHRRPIRYLREVLALDDNVPKPLMLPRMESVTPWLSALRRDLEGRPLRPAGLLDRTGLLFDVVASLDAGSGPLAKLPRERDRFFPWGMRLAELLEELLRHGRAPANLEHVADEVRETAAALLERLGDIFAAYVAALDERGWTTPGLDAARVAERADEAAAMLAGRRVVLAGFHALAGTEETLFRALWEQGAEVVLHTDPALARGDSGHFACAEHRRWMARWKARPVLYGEEMYGPKSDNPPRSIRFVEGFDLHSQLAAMTRELGPGPHTDVAVVVPDSDALLPVLHHLPEADVNVSMGYPLARTALYRLLDTILALQESARPGHEKGGGDDARRWYWRELVALIRHPYLKMLEYAPGRPLRPALRALEQAIRAGGAFQRPDAATLSEAAFPEGDAEAGRALLGRVLDACLDRFAQAATLRDMGRAVRDLAALLLPPEGDETEAASPWRRFPLDAECLHRLLSSVVPALTDSAMSGDGHGHEVLFAVLRLLLERERVPFEADPLTGLQVMGMLESRLLRFEHVFVLGATDDALPGGPSGDPLLPDPLRLFLGLPDQGQRAMVAAYNFFGLLQGPGEAVICYHTGVQGTGPGASKGVRSRFVEQLLWQEEQRQGRLLEPGRDPVLQGVSFPVRPMPERHGAVAVTGPVRQALDALLREPISPTKLDAWLDCPVRFFHRFLTPLREVEDVAEEGDPRQLGTLVHEALQDFFAPRLGTAVDPSALDPGPLLDAFSGRLHAAAFFRQMPWDRRMTVERSGRERLRRFLANQGPTTVVDLEQGMGRDMRLPLDPSGQTRRLTGFADRVDRRPGGLIVLDYKTGTCTEPKAGVWDDQALWEALEGWTPGDPEATSALRQDMAEAMGSVQLPLYMLLHEAPDGTRPANAAWVQLKEDGKELPLFKTRKKADPDPERVRRAVDEQLPLLLGWLVADMATTEILAPRPGKLCEWCPFGANCPAT